MSLGSNKVQNGQIHALSLSGAQLVHLCMDSKIIGPVVALEEEKCHLKHFSGRMKVKVTNRCQIKVKMVIFQACREHHLYIYGWISKISLLNFVLKEEKRHLKHFW